jgi:hypothetical protein
MRTLMRVKLKKFVFGIVFLGASRWRAQIVVRLAEAALGI